MSSPVLLKPQSDEHFPKCRCVELLKIGDGAGHRINEEIASRRRHRVQIMLVGSNPYGDVYQEAASDAFFRDSWSYYASDCKTRLRNIREGIWQNIDHVIPFHKRKASSAASTFFQEPRLNPLLCPAPDNNFNVDRVYKEFLKCFHPERSLALDRKKKVKPEPKIKPKPKPTINQYSNEAAKMHCKYTPSYQKPRFASCHIFKYVTDRQLLEWEREANETKEVIKQTKDPYVMRELTKRLNPQFEEPARAKSKAE
ncbi:uncharacterized protein Dwil_GK27256 [Drosophila willistoni]|uniref:Uncharacterized protein n=1 Tax=Drosophila willistoni TaxID=7260 RepID=A0A0Q9WQV3_DROWI|nr:uncharacterized protein Dwil_GK27256 [Drosophila willistoni]